MSLSEIQKYPTKDSTGGNKATGSTLAEMHYSDSLRSSTQDPTRGNTATGSNPARNASLRPSVENRATGQ